MLQIILLFIGVVGFLKKKIKISSKTEMSGLPVILLSSFYLFIAIISFFVHLGLWDLLIYIAIIAVVTILAIIFAPKVRIESPVVS